jgi:hypothetical protein
MSGIGLGIPKTNRVTWSEEIFRIMRQPPDYEPDYELFLQRLFPADRDGLERRVRNCLSAKKGSHIDYRVVRPSAEVRTVVCTSEVLPGGGQLTGAWEAWTAKSPTTLTISWARC